MRKVMRRKFRALTEGKKLNDEDFDDLLNAHESENEDGGDEDEEISDIDSESKEDQVISRVRIGTLF
jgi:hypothetical protein